MKKVISKTGKTGSTVKSPKKILIADDDPGILDIFHIILEQAGYVTDLRKSGEDLLKNNFSIPDLFLIDKQLSGYDGLDICRHLKTNTSTKHVPVIMISAAPDIGNLSQKAGADFFIEKPFDLKELLNVIKHFT